MNDPDRWRAIARLVNQRDDLAGLWTLPESELTWTKKRRR